MSSAEARRMSPEEQSAPKSERKPRVIEEMVRETPEAKAETPGEMFAADANDFMRLQDRSVDKALELSKLQDNPLASPETKAKVQKELDDLQAMIDGVVDGYPDTEDFVADAMTMRDLEVQMAKQKGRVKELNAIKETMNYPGGERMLSLDIDFATDKVVELSRKMDSLKKGYDAKEKVAKENLAGLTGPEIDAFVDGALKENHFADLKDEEIDAALDGIEQPILLTPDMMKKPEQNAEYMDAIASAKSVDDLKIVIDHMGDIKGTGGKNYSRKDLMAKIDHAMIAPILLGEITRTNGLRDKVAELIKMHRENEEARDKYMQERINGMIEEELVKAPPAETGTQPLDAKDLETPKGEEYVHVTPESRAKAMESMKKAKEAAEDQMEKEFFAKGDEMSEVHARGEEYEETVDVQDEWILDEQDAPSKEEVKDVVEKNELSPERRAVVEAEIQKLENQIYDFEAGAEYVERNDEGKITGIDHRPGMKELEAKLREKYGLDADTMMEKKALSPLEGLKLGLKGLFSRDFKRTMQMYEQRMNEWSDAKQRLEEAKMELRDPRGYAETMSRRYMKTMLLRAKQNARSSSGSRGGSPLGMRF
ncbi:MAG TPA: hypothetical protein VL500_00645 [Candidatus Eisenbacteria bacterium]|nr:hypothetical protein [Candidatus Eisenbacteria bacterium]